MSILVRHSKIEDIVKIMDIFSIARDFMKKTGNPNQWGDDWPIKEVILDDIKNETSYVILENDEIVGTFAFIIGIDETYNVIYDGNWLSNKPYGTIHRLASNGKTKGIFKIALEYSKKFNLNIRIDTHEDNKVMQNLLINNGFTYCGKIICMTNTERIAYELLNEDD